MLVGASGQTVQQCFIEAISKELVGTCTDNFELVGIFLRGLEEQLYAVDSSVSLDIAIQSFGSFLRYNVHSYADLKNHSIHV